VELGDARAPVLHSKITQHSALQETGSSVILVIVGTKDFRVRSQFLLSKKESLDLNAAFSLLGFPERATWRFPRLAPHVAVVTACISGMRRRADLPSEEDMWGSHPPCSLSGNSGVHSKCQNSVHQIIS